MRRSFGRISGHLRPGSSLSANSSHSNLLTQLADPLTFPSNRERRLCQITHQKLTPQDEQPPSPSGLISSSELDTRGLSAELVGTCWSPGSFNSALLLNATNASDCNTSCPPAQNRASYGLGSLVGSLRDVSQKGSTDGTTSETLPDPDTSGTVRSPTTQAIGMLFTHGIFRYLSSLLNLFGCEMFSDLFPLSGMQLLNEKWKLHWSLKSVVRRIHTVACFGCSLWKSGLLIHVTVKQTNKSEVEGMETYLIRGNNQ